MISKELYDTSTRYASDGYSFKANNTETLLRMIKLERKHRDVLDVVEDKLMEIRDTDSESIHFDCPKTDYEEVKEMLKWYRFGYYDKNIKIISKDTFTYDVELFV